MDLSKFLDLYLSDGAEHVQRLREALPAGEESSADGVRELFRSAHSLKGMAASMGFELTTSVAHHLESLLGRWRDGEASTEAQRTAALRAVDTLDALLDAVRARGAEAGLEETVFGSVEALRRATASVTEARAQPAPMAPRPAPAPVDAPPFASAAKLTVSIQPSSPLPVARLMVVARRLQEELGRFKMEPELEQLRKDNLRSADFTVESVPGLKELARALKTLPDVADVVLELPPDKPADGTTEAALVHSVRVRSEDLDALLARASELLDDLNQLEAGLAPEDRRRHRFWLEGHRSHLNRLFDDVLSVRLVSFEALAERLARTVRELSAKLGKPVRLEVTGAAEQVDRGLLEKLLDPMLHLTRNALDHGLEDPAQRRAAGKAPEGQVALQICREGEALLLTLSDDGRGIDLEEVRRAAVDRGLYTAAEAADLAPEQLYDVLTAPAFSTRKEVSEVSGRGVGLDVVRAAAESLGGYLEIESAAGAGSRFTLVVPTAVTLTRVLVFGWGPEVRFAVPTSQVRHIYPLGSHPLVWSGDHRFLQSGEEMIPVLAWRCAGVDRTGLGLRLIGPTGDRVLLVSQLFQAEKVVILPWGSPLEMVPDWMGGALLSTGEIAFVLDGRAVAKREVEVIHVP
jgi:two-component system chemotaxis sensor kinase CheA